MSILNIASTLGSSIASSIASSLASTPKLPPRATQDFSQIAQALQVGNLPGAKNAFLDLAQQVPAALKPVQQDFSSLGSALASGSLSQAQNAFSKLYLDSTGIANQIKLFG